MGGRLRAPPTIGTFGPSRTCLSEGRRETLAIPKVQTEGNPPKILQRATCRDGARFAGTRREGPKRSSDGFGQGKRPRAGGPWRDVPHGRSWRTLSTAVTASPIKLQFRSLIPSLARRPSAAPAGQFCPRASPFPGTFLASGGQFCPLTSPSMVRRAGCGMFRTGLPVLLGVPGVGCGIFRTALSDSAFIHPQRVGDGAVGHLRLKRLDPLDELLALLGPAAKSVTGRLRAPSMPPARPKPAIERRRRRFAPRRASLFPPPPGSTG